MSPLVDVRLRRRRPELMDDRSLDAARHGSALEGLARIHRWSGTVGAIWSAIEATGLASGGARVRVLDLASGGGDVPIGLWKRARHAGVPVEIVGGDLSPVAVAFARQRAERAGAAVEFRVVDVLADALPTGFDVVTNSLFLHHLDEDDVVAFLGRAAAVARRAVIVEDLVRCRAGHWLARVGPQLLSRSDVVHHDALRSVEGAYTVDEARALVGRAGLAAADVVPRFPWRWQLRWTRP